MASIKWILDKERSKADGTVVLFLEGNFIKAYEHSAMYFNVAFGYKVNVRDIKVVGETVVSAGFPADKLQERFPGAVLNEGFCVVSVPPMTAPMDFIQWKNKAVVDAHLASPQTIPQRQGAMVRCEDLRRLL